MNTGEKIMQPLYEGKAKQLFPGPDPHTVIVFFKDTVTAGDGTKRDSIPGKGALAAQISIKLFEVLPRTVPSHYIKKLDAQSFLAHKVQIIPLEVVVRNFAAGSIVKRLGLARGQPFDPPLVELFYKSDALHDPLICDVHALSLGLATPTELAQLKDYALQANRALTEYFEGVGLKLIDMKFEFGKTPDGKILLADEISPDTMRLWDARTNESLDKDVFREDKGDLLAVYREVARRIGIL